MAPRDQEHDVVVIGAGPAGEVCAAALVREGLDVVLVERELVGGECAYWACMPSKALLRPLELLAEVRRVPGAREALRPGPPDAAAILQRRDEVIHDEDDTEKLQRLADRGVRVIRGTARLAGPRRVQIEDDSHGPHDPHDAHLLTARRAVVIATGSGTEIPPIPGLDDRLNAWTSRQGSTATAVPHSLIVLGGGAVGCELAQAWAALGARTTLIETEPRLLAGEEPFASELLQDALVERHIDVRTDATVTRIDQDGTALVVTLDDGTTISAERLLLATGRAPRTDDLGLETVDLAPGSSIAVDDQMRVTVPAHREWLYAIGDVNGRALLTHVGKYQALVAVATIMNRPAAATHDGPVSPRVVFTDPQVAAVGLTLQSALDQGIPARAIDADPEATPGGSFVGKGAPANVRIVVDEQRSRLVGATFCGPDVAESLHAATIAIVGEIPLSRLVHAIPTFPTRSEVWLTLLADWRP